MDQLGLSAVGGDLRNRADFGVPHDDGVALDVAEALGIAHHPGIEHLGGVVLGHGPGDHPALGVLALQVDLHIALRRLIAVGQQPLGDDGLAAGGADNLGVPLGGVHAPDLDRVHLDGGALLQVDHRPGIEDFAALAVAFGVVLFAVMDLGVLPYMEGVDAVVAGFLVAAVVDAAAGHNLHVAVLPDVEVVIHRLLNAGLGDDDGDVALLAHGAVQDADIDAAFAVGPVVDLDMLRGLPAVAAAVLADVESPHGLAQHVRDLLQKLTVHLCIHHLKTPSFVRTGHPDRVSDRIWGRMSLGEPRWRSCPSPTTITSSAREMIRSWWEMIIMVAVPAV